ncbi:MAG: hypothetical protein QOI12_85 [Alphaproteobacteria bacterium]|jgi:hypothetical protein|nr:hypothetical protein [Alphaproteobacteria bacterium]
MLLGLLASSSPSRAEVPVLQGSGVYCESAKYVLQYIDLQIERYDDSRAIATINQEAGAAACEKNRIRFLLKEKVVRITAGAQVLTVARIDIIQIYDELRNKWLQVVPMERYSAIKESPA